MPRLIIRHALPLRLSHWANVPILAVMTWSGVAISGAKEPYYLPLAGGLGITLFPEIVFRELSIPGLAEGIGWHFTFAWLFLANGLFYLVWTIASGKWRGILPDRNTPADAAGVLAREFGVIEGQPDDPTLYNGAQRIAYTAAILIGFGLAVTGLAIMRPIQLGPIVGLLGGYQATRALHFWLTMVLVGFVFVHLLQVARAGWNTLRAMLFGFLVVDREGQNG